MIQFFREVGSHFFRSNTFDKAASLSFYAVFSLLPMIIIVTTLLGVIFGEQAVSGEIYVKLKEAFGDAAAQQIEESIKDQHVRHYSIFTSLVGIVTLLFSASGMSSQIHKSFNGIWNVMAKPKYGILYFLTVRFISFSILILFFFIMLIGSTMTSFLMQYLGVLQQEYQITYLYERIVSFGMGVLIFSLMFHFLSDAKVHWKASLAGGIFTTVLFIVGKIAIDRYIIYSEVSSVFGSASVLALMMLWVYYTAQIIYLGASFIKIFSDRMGFGIKPKRNAIRLVYQELED